MNDGLKKKAVTGAIWLTVAEVSGQALKFIVAVVLARLLAPEVFGQIGMVLVFSGFAKLFNDLGFSVALIQRPEVDDRHYSSVFWLNAVISILLALSLVSAAPGIAAFFDQPGIEPVIRLMAFEFPLGAIVIVQRAQLAREMDFRALSVIEIFSVLLAGGLGIWLALRGAGVFALVAQVLGMAASQALLLTLYSSKRPKRVFSWSALGDLWRFSAGILGGNTLNYWTRNADNLLIGKFLGSTELGLYSRAYAVMLLPLTLLTYALSRVMFPALSSIQKDKARCRRVYLRAIGCIAFIAFPMMLGLSVVANEFVLLVFGAQWAEMVPLLRVLCIVGMLQSVNATVGWIYTSQGRSDLQFVWTLGSGILTVLAIVIGLNWGILGVGVGIACRVVLTTWLNFYIPGRLIGMSVHDVFGAVRQPLLLALCMAAVVLAVSSIVPADWPLYTRLFTLIGTGALFYGAATHLVRLPAYRDLLDIVRDVAQGGLR